MRRRQRSAATATGQHAVIGTLEWLVNLIVLAIPIVGLIMCIIWAIGIGNNLNRRNFARAALILLVAVILLGVIFGVTMFQSLIKPYLDLMQKV